MAVPTPLARFFVLFVLILARPVLAMDGARLSLGSVHGPGWSADGVVATLAGLQAGTPRLRLQAARVRVPGIGQTIADLQVSCTRLHWDPSRIQCLQGVFSAASAALSAPLAGTLAFDYRPADGSLDLTLHDVAFAGGALALTARLQRGEWQADLQGTRLHADRLLAQLRTHGMLKGYSGKGEVGLRLQVSGANTTLRTVRMDAQTLGLSFANASGTHAGENLGIEITTDLAREGGAWTVRSRVHAGKGQLYADPLYLEVPDKPIVLQARGQWYPARRQLQVTAFRWEHPGVVDARGTLKASLGSRPALEALDLELVKARLGGLYTNYLQPWLVGTLAGDLQDVAGNLHGRLSYRDGVLGTLNLQLDDGALRDKQGRFAFGGLSGLLDWARDDAPRRSEVSWQSGSLYRIALGPAQVALQSKGMAFSLRKAARIPVLDGDLLIDKAAIEEAGTPHMRWDFNGVLTPISLQTFTKAVGWPVLSGKLSGVIPEVRYRGGVLQVGGVLLVRVFGGDITMRDVRMERPFGLVPRLQANINVDRINLNTLTRTFSFGKIEGLLSGHVRDLRMVDWQPVSFDAAFATPPGDDSRHRISQKALSNLSSIGGGGMGGALSRGFLRLFKDFPYDRLGISCRLRNGICAMNGVAPAKQGYYIVKGRFLPPRVDVIGFAHEVDWTALIEQLKAATQAQSPTVR